MARIGRVLDHTIPIGAFNLGISGGSNNQVMATGSNGETFFTTYVRTISADGSNYLLNPDVNFASGSNIVFTFDRPPLGGGAFPSNTLRIHSTSGGGAALSYGSNATRVSEDASGGVNTNVSRSDHRHDGIGQVVSNSSNTLQRGTFNIKTGNNISFGLTDSDGDGELDTVQIHAAATSGGGGGGSSSGALVFLESHTASASATLDFTTFISATYDEYLLELVNLIPATDGVNFYMRVGTGGGPTWDAGNNYAMSSFRWAYDGSAAAGNSPAGGVAQWQPDGGSTIKNTSTYGVVGSMRLYSPQSTALYKRVNSTISFPDTQGTLHMIGTNAVLTYVSTTAITGVRFLFSSGNITSGTVRVYGITTS